MSGDKKQIVDKLEVIESDVRQENQKKCKDFFDEEDIRTINEMHKNYSICWKCNEKFLGILNGFKESDFYKDVTNISGNYSFKYEKMVDVGSVYQRQKELMRDFTEDLSDYIYKKYGIGNIMQDASEISYRIYDDCESGCRYIRCPYEVIDHHKIENFKHDKICTLLNNFFKSFVIRSLVSTSGKKVKVKYAIEVNKCNRNIHYEIRNHRSYFYQLINYVIDDNSFSITNPFGEFFIPGISKYFEKNHCDANSYIIKTNGTVDIIFNSENSAAEFYEKFVINNKGYKDFQ